jgi:hypothetical protein
MTACRPRSWPSGVAWERQRGGRSRAMRIGRTQNEIAARRDSGKLTGRHKTRIGKALAGEVHLNGIEEQINLLRARPRICQTLEIKETQVGGWE